ncbi:MAG: hypothetical protein R3F65_16530 [bacterium]
MHRLAAILALALALTLAACAGELERGEAPIRTGDRDGGEPVDARWPDAASPDADLDAAPDAAPLPDRALWIVERPDPWSDGVRAALDPPHRPAGPDPLTALPEAAVLVRWRGPADPATATLQARLADPSRPTGLLYALGDRLAALRDDPPPGPAADWPFTVATADASWLAARLPDAARPLRLADAPLIAVDADWTDPAARAAFAALHDRYTALAPPARWAAVVDPAALDVDAPGLPDGLAAVIPRCGAPDPAARARLRAATAALAWLPCAAPPTNPRLDRPTAVAAPPAPAELRRRLVLARRDGAPIVIVDGAGGWRDDRQLDPVDGAPTAAPFALTTALVYAPYGTDRLAAVRETLLRPAGPVPATLADPPALLELVRTPGVTIDRLDATPGALALALRDADGRGRYELLLDDRPFIVPPDATLRYHRSDPAIALDLVFADGARLLDALPADEPHAGAVEARLAPFAGRRVEELTLVYRGGARALDARVDRPVIATDP